MTEIYALSLINYHIDGEGKVFIDDNGAVDVETADEHAVFYMELQDSLNNGGEMVLHVDWLKEFSEKGFLLSLQGKDVNGEMRVFYQKHYKNPEDAVYLSIADSFTNISVGIQGNVHFRLDNIRYTGGSWVNEEVLVRVCDNGGDRYRFGFNGQEKVNEIAGMGTHLDFGARIYDSRVGRFLSLDPLMNKFPYQSPYVFAGSNPILLIDEEGEEKKVYYYVIDMRDNTIKIPTAPSIENGLYMRNVRPYNGLDYYTYHDYSINQVTLIDENGKKQVYYSKPFNIDYKKDRLKTIGPSTTYARIRTGEINLNFLDNPTKEWSTIKFEGGLQLTSKSNAPWIGRDNRYNKSGKGESVYVDDLLSMLTMVSNGNFIKNGNELIRNIDYLNKALSNTSELQNNKRNSSGKDTLLYFQPEDGQSYLKTIDKDSLDVNYKPAEKTKDGKYFNSNNVYEKK